MAKCRKRDEAPQLSRVELVFRGRWLLVPPDRGCSCAPVGSRERVKELARRYQNGEALFDGRDLNGDE